MINMYKILQSALVEKDIENAYKTALLDAFGHLVVITSPHNTDGVLKANNYRGEKDFNLIMLLECKYDTDFSKRLDVICVLIQALYYLKKFEQYGEDLPNVILVGDKNECFCIHSNDIIKYLSEEIDWTIAPSEAYRKNPKLIAKMAEDNKITPYIFFVDDKFKFDVVIEKAIELSKNITNYVRITEMNIDRVFKDFVENVLYYKKITKEDANKLVNIFMSVITNKADNYLHPEKKQVLVTKDSGNVRVNRHKFEAFFRHFDREYTPKEKNDLVAICDRLIEDTTRRFQGEFFTPTPWVLEAHKMIEQEFGVNWRDEYVVWDPAWGTGNLTRDFKFKELYVSTLNASDIGIAEQRGYNPEAVKFQFDFLNDSYDKLPQGLRDAIESDQKILVLMNPPYGTGNDLKFLNPRTGTATNSKINSDMLSMGMGKASHQLYAQFLFRIMNEIQNYKIAIFSPALFLSGNAFKKFRTIFLENCSFINGMMFEAKHFSDVVSGWGICFTLWTSGPTKDKYNFIHSVRDIDTDGKIKEVGTKIVYNVDQKSKLLEFARLKFPKENTELYPHMTSGLSLSNKNHMKIHKNAIGFLVTISNSVYKNGVGVSLMSAIGTQGNAMSGFSVVAENLNPSIAMFTARKSITSNWINQKDEYLAPNTEHPDYQQWNNDCLVYSLFNNSSNQSSLRNIEYKGKIWNIENQWFWVSVDTMAELSNKHHFDELYNDVNNFGANRFVYNKLQNLELSKDAINVLSMAENLVYESMEYRSLLHQEHPEYHLNAWDAGWYQIKLILKQFLPDRLKEFTKIYKEFENRMREGVYKFGFLKE